MKRLATIILVLFSGHLARCETQTFGVLADGGLWNTRMSQIRDSLNSLDVKNLVLPGDNIYDSKTNRLSYGDVWSNFAAFSLGVVAIGNHNHGYGEEIAYFKMPAEYYSKTYGTSIRFIVLNSDDDALGSTQSQWLEKELASATEPFVFLVYHHPPYTFIPAHPWTQKKNFHEAVRPVIWKYRSKITALLLGHDHMAALIYLNDLPAIVSGATHEGHMAMVSNPVQDGVKVKLEWGGPGFTDALWAELVLDTANGSALVRFVDATTGTIPFSTELKKRP